MRRVNDAPDGAQDRDRQLPALEETEGASTTRFDIPRRDERAEGEEDISDSDHPAARRSGGVGKAEASHRRGHASGHEYDLNHSGDDGV